MDVIKQGKPCIFNLPILPVIRSNEHIPQLLRLIEKEQELKAEKNEYINEMVEKGYERNIDLIERIREDTKEWKQLYKSGKNKTRPPV